MDVSSHRCPGHEQKRLWIQHTRGERQRWIDAARWVARYTFGQTGRPVVNDVRSLFQFDEAGLIADQHDDFDFWRWSRQALGPVGLLVGWTPVLQHSVRDKARAGLAAFRDH